MTRTQENAAEQEEVETVEDSGRIKNNDPDVYARRKSDHAWMTTRGLGDQVVDAVCLNGVVFLPLRKATVREICWMDIIHAEQEMREAEDLDFIRRVDAVVLLPENNPMPSAS